MKILVLGGSGRTGRHLISRIEAAGHVAVALGRRAPKGWQGEVIVAAPDDRAAVSSALDGVNAVMGALGSSRTAAVCLPATQALIDVARKGLPYVVIGGAGVDTAGDTKALPDRIAGGMMRIFAGRMLAERQAELNALQASGLEFCFLRPPQLHDRPGTGHWVFTLDRPAHFRIARADLAGAMLEALGRTDLARKAPFVAGLR